MVAFLDYIALLEEDLFQVAFHSGLDLDSIDRIHAANKVARLRDLLPLGIDSADWSCFLLSASGNGA
jgi:hypothetical protein